MNNTINTVIASENILPIEVAKKLLEDKVHFNIIKEINYGGCEKLKKDIRSFHTMAYNGISSIVIADLDKGIVLPNLLVNGLV